MSDTAHPLDSDHISVFFQSIFITSWYFVMSPSSNLDAQGTIWHHQLRYFAFPETQLALWCPWLSSKHSLGISDQHKQACSPRVGS